MEQLGWIAPGSKRPKMIAVQSSGCAPIVRAFDAGETTSTAWQDADTFAAGLRVPKAYGDFIILDILRQSGGKSLAIPDETIFASLLDWARSEGILLSPEGAAATAAYDALLVEGFLQPSDRCVIFNTGAGIKYADVIADWLKRAPANS
jgi:threonine synthase